MAGWRCVWGCAATLLAVNLCGCASFSVEDLRAEPYRPRVDGSRTLVSAWDLDVSRGTADRPLRVLKRGDKLVISLRGIPNPEEIQNVIDDNGNVTLPLIGSVRFEGKTQAEAERAVERAYVEGGYYRKIDAIVVAQDDEYFVQGEVQRPGRYPLSGELTLLQAVSAAGGYTDYANPKRIRIRRGGDARRFNARRIERRRETDPLIRRGDIVVVPRRWF